MIVYSFFLRITDIYAIRVLEEVMIKYLNRLCSSESGNPSSSRFIAVYLTLWGTIHLSVCTFLQISSVIDGNGIAMLLMAAYGSTAVKKPFEDKPYDKRPFKFDDNEPLK